MLLRVGDAGSSRGFAVSQWVDRAVTMAARPPRAADLSAGRWRAGSACCEALGFAVHAVPMSRGTPFANVLLVADLGGRAR